MTPDELEFRINRHLEGRASEQEAAALSREITSNPQARRLYLKMAGIHAALAAGEAPGGDEGSARIARSTRWTRHPLAWAAALALMAAGGWFAWLNRPATFAPGEATPVDKVCPMENARWIGPETRLQPGDPLRPGQLLELSTGSAVVEFVSGARVTLLAPCIFEVTSANGGFLSLGQLKAVADTPQSKGFTVRTRTAKVVDIGTEFVAAAAPDGQSRVDVTSGEVDVHLDGASAPHRLRTGEALSVEAGQAQVLVRIEPGDGTAAFRFPSIEPPSNEDYADVARGAATIRVIRGALRSNVPIPSGPPHLLLDGRGQPQPDSPAESVFFDDNAPGALLVDLGRPIWITKINTYSWHQNRDAEVRTRAVQKFTLYGYVGDDSPKQDGSLAEREWELLARVDSDDFLRVVQALDRPAQQACSITGVHGALGRYRYLRWEVQPSLSRNLRSMNNTFYSEFDVYGTP
jgi:hypothetical protein